MDKEKLRKSILVLGIILGVYNLIILNIAYFIERNLPNIPYTLIGILYFSLTAVILIQKEGLLPFQKWIHYFFMAFILTELIMFLRTPEVLVPVADWLTKAFSLTMLVFIWQHLQKLLIEKE